MEKQSAGNTHFSKKEKKMNNGFTANFITKTKLCINAKQKTISSCRSSETLSKASSFDFQLFYKYGQAPHVQRISEAFLEWFIGFFEGDGTFYFYDTLDKRNGRKSCRLLTSFAQKEKNIVEIVHKTFGFGNIRMSKKKDQVYWRWEVGSKEGLERLAWLFTGNLILPKRQTQFLEWLDTGQRQNLFLSLDRAKPWASEVSLENGWLSGFIDAEGCFYANNRETKNGRRNSTGNLGDFFYQNQLAIEQKLTLVQKDINGGEKTVFLKILFLFESQSSVYNFTNGKSNTKYIRIEFGCKKTQKRLIDYLCIYKLRTFKNTSFHKWRKLYDYRVNPYVLSEKGVQKLKRLMKSINVHSKKSYL